jgi:predicted O-methyltransferase YrrM
MFGAPFFSSVLIGAHFYGQKHMIDTRKIAETAIEKYFAMQKLDELTWMLDRAMEIKPKNILEIGAGRGGTLYCWDQLPTVESIVVIDMPQEEYRVEGETPLKDISNIAYIIEGDSHARETYDYFRNIADGREFDVLLIDGDHSYGGARADFQAYVPYVRKGGLVFIHDICEQVGSEVHKLYQEIGEDPYFGNKCSICVTEPTTWGGVIAIKI